MIVNIATGYILLLWFQRRPYEEPRVCGTLDGRPHLRRKMMRQVLLDILDMDGMSNFSPNGYLWVGCSQIYRQAFFTSRTRSQELRKSVPSRVRFPFAFGRMMNLVRTDLPSISTITWVVRASPVVY
ncbi:uncharacterized protein NPIL_286271 [Nephila pilipes]|uniref:Uncharacterized protein n=1 Tax=Nephila pilipes TaxID=299642 RepID=A0A8X6QR28_NEPPI|nr:uncharacterized protein NPIL_286271 [Nephila pilipes]